jgi:hypothetical protein
VVSEEIVGNAPDLVPDGSARGNRRREMNACPETTLAAFLFELRPSVEGDRPESPEIASKTSISSACESPARQTKTSAAVVR